MSASAGVVGRDVAEHPFDEVLGQVRQGVVEVEVDVVHLDLDPTDVRDVAPEGRGVANAVPDRVVPRLRGHGVDGGEHPLVGASDVGDELGPVVPTPASMSALRCSRLAYIGVSYAGPCPGEQVDHRVGVACEMGQHVAARPAGEQRGLACLVVGQAVDVGEDGFGRGDQGSICGCDRGRGSAGSAMPRTYRLDLRRARARRVVCAGLSGSVDYEHLFESSTSAHPELPAFASA